MILWNYRAESSGFVWVWINVLLLLIAWGSDIKCAPIWTPAIFLPTAQQTDHGWRQILTQFANFVSGGALPLLQQVNTRGGLIMQHMYAQISNAWIFSSFLHGTYRRDVSRYNSFNFCSAHKKTYSTCLKSVFLPWWFRSPWNSLKMYNQSVFSYGSDHIWSGSNTFVGGCVILLQILPWFLCFKQLTRGESIKDFNHSWQWSFKIYMLWEIILHHAFKQRGRF